MMDLTKKFWSVEQFRSISVKFYKFKNFNLICQIISFLIFIVSTECTNHSSTIINRESKFIMSVSVPPVPCGAQNQGVCLPRRKCASRKGDVVDVGTDCSQGFGQCCSFTQTCDSLITDVTQHVTTLNSPQNPTSPCGFRVRRQTNVCQISVKFLSMELNGADSNGACGTDSFSIRGSVTVAQGFKMCGKLTGETIYLSYGGVSDTIELLPVITSQKISSYSLLVTQIPCNSPTRVPDHCLQSFNGASRGVVKSFDYGGQQQSSQRYTVCVDGSNRGSIRWMRCSAENSGNLNPFLIQGSPSPLGDQQGVGTCGGDWVQINGRDRQCSFPNIQITSEFSPFLLNVNFDDTELPTLPWLEEIAAAQSEEACTNVELKYPTFVACQFFPDPNECQCTVTEAAKQLFGTPDVSNTGFCLEFSKR